MILQFLQTHFQNFTFTEEELHFIEKSMQIVAIKKNEIFTEENRKNSKLGVVVKGSLFSSSLDTKGNEIIKDLFYQNKYFVFDYESYLTGENMKVTIKANEDSIVLVSTLSQMKNLSKKFPRLYHLEISVLEQHFAKALNRIKILQEKDTAIKLKILQERFPNVFVHFTFSQIASYLGLHRNTITSALKSSNM